MLRTALRFLFSSVFITSVISTAWADGQAAQLPAFVVATTDTVLSTGSAGAPPVRLGRPNHGVPLDVKGPGPGDTLTVQVHGGIELQGLVARDTLGVVVCESGPQGDRYYLGRGNVLRLRSAIVDGKVEVEGSVLLPKKPSDHGRPWNEQYQTVPFSTQLDIRRLCTTPPKRPAGTAEDPGIGQSVGELNEGDFPGGTPFIAMKRGVALSLYDRPGGAVIYTRSPDPWGYALARISQNGKWDLVAAGEGPYLLGWMPARPPRKKPAPLDILVGGLEALLPGPMALNTDGLQRLPLHELPAGTELRQFGIPVARLTRAGYARLSPVRDGAQYAVVAVDDDVVAEGWLDPTKVGALVSPPAKQTAAAPPTSSSKK